MKINDQLLVTHAKLWLPDKKSPWGKRLATVWKIVGKKSIYIPQGFTFAKWHGILSLTTRQELIQTARWNVALLPKQQQPAVFQTLTQTFRGPCAVRAFVNGKQTIHYCIIINENKEPVAVGQREILSTGEVFHHLLRVDTRWQSKGYGGRLLCNAVSWYKALEVPKVHSVKIIAGLSAGGSVWPKFGFRPIDNKEWTKIHSRIRRNAKAVPLQVKDEFQRRMKQDVAAYLEEVFKLSANAIWAISDLDKREETGRIRILVSGKTGAATYGLGTFLLRGTRWRGVLDLNQGTAMARFENCFKEKARKSGEFYACI